MKVLVIKDHSGVEDKDKPIGMEAQKGQIVSMNPNTAKNWLIPLGFVVEATEENLKAYHEKWAQEEETQKN